MYYNEDSVVKIVGLVPDQEKNVLRVVALAGEKGYKSLSQLKERGIIKSFYNTYRTGSAFVVDMAREYSDSVTSILSRNGAVVLSSSKYNGMEEWNVLIYEHHIPHAMKELDSVAHVESYREIDYAPFLTLTRQEYRTLYAALAMGYFEYPKKVRAKEVAKVLGIRESTFVYHVRNAQRKLFTSYLKGREPLLDFGVG
ncbi:bacterio-opsin activator [Sulfodiicoccus acidiphilus]|uniref:Bacterio-opsin activator n=2 Tax=Sulfodiicoccus acidiphilus TaxID=1670455 RepID=A0A348B1W0_9CREN|nr:helix-turn-helix domain-containing protein [Sulfodiicoccus acidiphilus]BBD72162.1 bacterio-opsin activator [Sulfodiicoccus acidiphilus]GGT94563.1 bacterio-opsin activator [Sulfodiicoccus acidiphilus]